MTCEYHDIDPADAIYNLALSYPGGIKALADRMGASAGVMYKKLEPGTSSHHLNLAEFCRIIDYSREAKRPNALLPLMALNYRYNIAGFQLPEIQSPADEDLQAVILKVMTEYGDVARAIADAKSGDTREERRISIKEVAKIKHEFREAFEAMAALQAMVLAEAETQEAAARNPLRAA